MKSLDKICAGILFVWAIVDCWLIPRNYTGRIWLLGTELALLFTAMLNLLRIRNGYGVRGLKMFCLTANVTTFAFFVSLLVSIGRTRTLANPQLVIVAALIALEAVFSLRKNA